VLLLQVRERSVDVESCGDGSLDPEETASVSGPAVDDIPPLLIEATASFDAG